MTDGPMLLYRSITVSMMLLNPSKSIFSFLSVKKKKLIMPR